MDKSQVFAEVPHAFCGEKRRFLQLKKSRANKNRPGPVF